MQSSHSNQEGNNPRNFTPLITILSIVLIGLISALFFLPGYKGTLGFDVTIFPLLNAIFNCFTFISLLLALIFVKKKKITLHRNFILAAFCSTALFLVSYVIYHSLTEPTRFGGDPFWKGVYLFILLTHIVLAAVNVPLALFTVTRGFTKQVERHRRIARWTMPIWLYVSLTGVLVYIMISPYY
ncbi:DUF420 domain-containing protein [Paenibacillus sp. y28]|uniref:DUF420 domain-containing protein n=1 Tax=Paenibacillus sp. y28 TaxID=3129110 RepID=UPI003019E820